MSKHSQISSKTTLNIHGNLINLDKPAVMGIINITPDSFYEGSRVQSSSASVEMAGKMLDEGATFLDLGGFSTRPGAKDVSEEEEQDRVLPVLKEILTNFPAALISVDTFRASLAQQAIAEGAAIINDITAGSDPKMFDVIKESGTPYIMMHMRGPVTKMMDNLEYENLLVEITSYFQKRLQVMREKDIKDIIIDPGFGFSKSLDQNYEILKNLTYFEALDAPIIVGVSRKSMIYNLLETTAEGSLIGTSVINFAALEKGARILRVHDVKEAVETVKIFNKIID